MRVEIMLATQIGRRLNGEADDVRAVLTRYGIVPTDIVDKNYAGTATIHADVPLDLIPLLQSCRKVLSIRREGRP